MAPNGARRIFVPTNPDLADILGRTDLDFEHFYVFDFVDPKFLDFQVPRSPNFWISMSPAGDLLDQTRQMQHQTLPQDSFDVEVSADKPY